MQLSKSTPALNFEELHLEAAIAWNKPGKYIWGWKLTKARAANDTSEPAAQRCRVPAGSPGEAARSGARRARARSGGDLTPKPRGFAAEQLEISSKFKPEPVPKQAFNSTARTTDLLGVPGKPGVPQGGGGRAGHTPAPAPSAPRQRALGRGSPGRAALRLCSPGGCGRDPAAPDLPR